MINKRYNYSNYQESFSINNGYWRFSSAHEYAIDITHYYDDIDNETTTCFLYKMIQKQDRGINKFDYRLNQGCRDEDEESFDNFLRRLTDG